MKNKILYIFTLLVVIDTPSIVLGINPLQEKLIQTKDNLETLKENLNFLGGKLKELKGILDKSGGEKKKTADELAAEKAATEALRLKVVIEKLDNNAYQRLDDAKKEVKTARQKMVAAEKESERQRKDLQISLGITDDEAKDMARFADLETRLLPELKGDFEGLQMLIREIEDKEIHDPEDTKQLATLTTRLAETEARKNKMSDELAELRKKVNQEKLKQYDPHAKSSEEVQNARAAFKMAEKILEAIGMQISMLEKAKLDEEANEAQKIWDTITQQLIPEIGQQTITIKDFSSGIIMENGPLKMIYNPRLDHSKVLQLTVTKSPANNEMLQGAITESTKASLSLESTLHDQILSLSWSMDNNDYSITAVANIIKKIFDSTIPINEIYQARLKMVELKSIWDDITQNDIFDKINSSNPTISLKDKTDIMENIYVQEISGTKTRAFLKITYDKAAKEIKITFTKNPSNDAMWDLASRESDSNKLASSQQKRTYIKIGKENLEVTLFNWTIQKTPQQISAISNILKKIMNIEPGSCKEIIINNTGKSNTITINGKFIDGSQIPAIEILPQKNLTLPLSTGNKTILELVATKPGITSDWKQPIGYLVAQAYAIKPSKGAITFQISLNPDYTLQNIFIDPSSGFVFPVP